MVEYSDFNEEEERGGAEIIPVSFVDQRGHSLYKNHFKRIFDIFLVVASAPITLPILLIFALLVKRDGGPAFYGQDRVGLDGETFTCWKLRTMVPNADSLLEEHLASDPALRDEWQEYQKLRNDPRITSTGRILRASSLDEIPQLWCVLKGEMSIVGPRPFLPEQQSLYHGKMYYRMRPGITGLWQVTGHNDTSFVDRVSFDDSYGMQLSLWTDVKIMFQTIAVMLRSDGV